MPRPSFGVGSSVWSRSGLALLSSLLVRVALPTLDVAPAIFIAWVPLLVASAASSPRTALLLGLLQGFVLGLFSHAWLVGALLRNFPTPVWGAVLALVLVALLVGLRSALVMSGVSFLRAASLPVWLSFPVLQVAAEQLIPGAFPWTNALAVSSTPIWQQAAAFGGSSAVSAWLCLSNGLLAEGWCARRTELALPRAGSAPMRLLSAAVLVVSAMTAVGAGLMWAETTRERAAPTIRIAIGHYDSSAQADPVAELRTLALLEQRSHRAPDLWIWPETMVSSPQTPRQLTRLANDYLRRDSAVATNVEPLTGPLLLGAVTEHGGILENSALLFTAGNVSGSYSKHVLMPVGETSTLVAGLSLPAASLGRTAPFRPGADSEPLSVSGHPLAISICYEDILAGFIFEQVARSRAELLVNLTSDRWFKGTSAVAFHFALARLRAVEHRKFLIRSTRDGVSAVIDGTGRVVASLSRHPSAIIAVDAPLLSGLSVAESTHDAVSIAVPLVAASLLLLGCLLRRRNKAPG